jgi:hypothetical protein
MPDNIRVIPHDRPSVSDDQPLSKTAVVVGHLDFTLSASDAWAMVALAAAKSVIMVALRIEDDDFTLKPASPELFMATFRS